MNSKIQALVLALTYFVGLEFLILKEKIFNFSDISWVLVLGGIVLLSQIFWFFFLPQFKSFNFSNFLKIIFIILFVAQSAIFILLFKNFLIKQGLLAVSTCFVYLLFWAFAQSTRLSLFAFNIFIAATLFVVFFTFITLFTLFFSYKISLILFHLIIFLGILFFYIFLFSLHFEIKKGFISNIWILAFLFGELFIILSLYPLNQFILSTILLGFFYIFWLLSFYHIKGDLKKSTIIESGIFLIVIFILILKFMPWTFYVQ